MPTSKGATEGTLKKNSACSTRAQRKVLRSHETPSRYRRKLMESELCCAWSGKQPKHS